MSEPRYGDGRPAESVVLVDESDVAIGTADKLEAHRSGMLHRAFSVVVVSPWGELLLQQRAMTKYHSAGLWSNACCGHPRPGEDTLAAAHRRLREEMGIECALTPCGALTYRAQLAGSIVEHEYDHVFIGLFNGEPGPDPDEVMSWRWSGARSVLLSVSAEPDRYTAWLPLVLPKALRRVSRSNGAFRSRIRDAGA